MTDPNRDQNTSPSEPAEGERHEQREGTDWQKPDATQQGGMGHGSDTGTGGQGQTYGQGGGDMPRNEPWRGDRVTDETDETEEDETTRQEQGTGSPR